MKSISIYIALIILFSINFRSVCVGGDKDKQSSGYGTTQEHGDKEKETSKQKERIENIQEPEKGTRDLDIKHSMVPREQTAAENSLMKKHNYGRGSYWMIDRYDGLYERDYFYNYYICDEGETDESLECCNCCEIL